jgi:c-di-GMP-binding flagellar brake protein YcgR
MESAAAHPFSRPTLLPDRCVLTPMAAAPSVAGRLLSYEAGLAGLAVRLTAKVTPSAAERLDAERVWVTANTGGRIVAFQSVAHRIGETALETNGITVPVEEHRRTHLRAATRIPIRLQVSHVDGREPSLHNGHTVDLSRGGCRVQLSDGDVEEVLGAGTTADVTLDLGTQPVVTAGEVLRVDPTDRQAVLTFGSLTVEDADRVERHVLNLMV